MATTGGPSSAPAGAEERVGPYRLIRRLGQGGMGIVYLAESPDHQEVAVKVLRPHVAHDPTARARLEREVTTLQRVSHPGVAGILDHDLHGDQPYLVTRFVPGRPLDEHVEQRGPLTPQRWLPVAGCLAEALQAIHNAGVVHRDLKPANVMMLDGRPVLIDFGIAQAADDLRLTATGMVVGTPGYMAPELIEGETVSESADWWGWAATMAFAATGRRPFGKGPFEVVLHRVHTGQADLEGIDPRLGPLLAAALSPDRRDRPTSTEIMTGLNRYAEGRDALVPNPYTATEESPVAPPTAVMTAVMPEPAPYDDPVAVARLVPPVIPPLSAFAPLRDKLRDAAAQHKARTAVPSHPATYSPTPTAAQPAALPLPYQGAGQGPAPLAVSPHPRTPGTPAKGDVAHRQSRQPSPQPSGTPGPHLQSTRSGLLLALMLALVGLIAMLPVVGMVVTTALIVLARVVDRSTTALLRRRQVRGGKGRSDGFVAVAASPVHLLTAALITVPCLVPPLLVAVTMGGLTALVAAAAQGFHWGPLSGVSVAVGAFFGLLTAWWGPGGKSLRRGSRAGLRSAIRPAWLSTLIAAALLAVAAVELLNAIHGGGTVWAPLNAPFDTSDLPSRPGLDNLRDLPLVRDLPFVSR